MAKLSNGILGPLAGKVGGVVAASWKGINYVRSYVIPANPQTTDQTANRTLFGNLVATAKLILASVIQPFWDVFQSQMSGFNRFMQVNMPLMSAGFDYSDLVIAQGSLEGQVIDVAQYASGSGSVSLGWVENILGNGASADTVVGVIIDSSNDMAYVGTGPRSDEEILMTIPTGLTAADLKAYLFCHRGSGAELEVSNSSYFQVTV